MNDLDQIVKRKQMTSAHTQDAPNEVNWVNIELES